MNTSEKVLFSTIQIVASILTFFVIITYLGDTIVQKNLGEFGFIISLTFVFLVNLAILLMTKKQLTKVSFIVTTTIAAILIIISIFMAFSSVKDFAGSVLVIAASLAFIFGMNKLRTWEFKKTNSTSEK